MTIVEALKELVLAYGGSASDGETVVDVLKDVTTAMGGSDTAGDTVSELIADITATVESGGGGGGLNTETIHVTFSAETMYLTVTESASDVLAIMQDGKIPAFEITQEIYEAIVATGYASLAVGDYYGIYANCYEEENETIFESAEFYLSPLPVLGVHIGEGWTHCLFSVYDGVLKAYFGD